MDPTTADTVEAPATCPSRRVRNVTCVLAAWAAVVVWRAPRVHPFLTGRWGLVEFAMLAALFAATEIFPVHLHFARNSHSFSLFEIPLTLGLFFGTSPGVIVAHVIGGGFALAAHRRQPLVKLGFNLAAFGLADVLAVVVFRAVAGEPGRFTVLASVAAGVGALAASVLSGALVTMIIRLAEGRSSQQRIPTITGFGAVSAIVSTSLGLIAVIVIEAQPSASWLLLFPTAGVYLANHSFASERRRQQGLEFLHDSTKLLHRTPELESAFVQLVGRARETFRSSFAELVYFPANSDEIVDVVDDGSTVTATVKSSEAPDVKLLMEHVARLREPQCHLRSGYGPAIVDYLDQYDLNDAAVAPLIGEKRTCGYIVIGNRHGDVAHLDRDDLVLLETLAANVTAALANGWLEQSIDQLRHVERKLTHQATHDSLTGLANRVLFTQQVTDAIASAARSEDRRVAVLFIDLDDLKIINDNLGHAAGDELLVALSRRLQNAIADSATAARLGGDEFAVVLPDVQACDDLLATADALLASIGSPAKILDRVVPIRASIGVAVADDGQDASEVLRNADTAMYAAKRRGKNRVIMFEPSLRDAATGGRGHTRSVNGTIDAGELDACSLPCPATTSS